MFKIVYLAVAFFIILTAVLILVKIDFSQFVDFFNSRSSDIAQKVDKDDLVIKAIADEASNNCTTKECTAYALYKYVRDNYILSDNEPPLKSVEDILHTRKGTSAELSFLLSSLLENKDIPTRIVSTPDRAYVSACGLSKKEVYNIISENIPTEYLFKDTVRIASNQLWTFNPEADAAGNNIRISALSSTPVDLYVFESDKDLISAEGEKHFFPECTVIKNDRFTVDCFVSDGNVIAVSTQYGEAAVDFSVEKVNLQLNDIALQNFDIQNCIPFDLTLKNGWMTVQDDLSEQKLQVIKP